MKTSNVCWINEKQVLMCLFNSQGWIPLADRPYTALINCIFSNFPLFSPDLWNISRKVTFKTNLGTEQRVSFLASISWLRPWQEK